MDKSHIVVAASNFASLFVARLFVSIRSNVKPGERLTQLTTFDPNDLDGIRSLLQGALARLKPTAFIGICIRPDPSVVAAFTAAGAPVILMDEEVDGASMVSGDHLQGSYAAADHLASRGRKKLAVISGPVGVRGGYNAEQRVIGFKKCLAERGLPLAPACQMEAPRYSYEDGYAALAQLIDGKVEVDGIVSAAGDRCAIGILDAARQRERRVPEDVAVVGYDDIKEAASSTPPLTTMRQPIEEMALAAYRMSTAERLELLAQPKKVLFKPELVIRGSS